MTVMSYRDALRMTLREELLADENGSCSAKRSGYSKGRTKSLRGCSRSSGHAVSATPQSRKKGSPVPRSVPRCSDCDRWWRS